MPIQIIASFPESSLPNIHIKRGYPKGKTIIEGQNAFNTFFCSLSSFIILGMLNGDLSNTQR